MTCVRVQSPHRGAGVYHACMARRPYSTARWQRLRALVLSGNPLCVYCKEQGRVTMGEHVDHVVPWKQGGEVWDPGNLQVLCATCHNSVKQKEEKRGERIGCGVDGTPLDPNHPWRKDA